MTTEEAELVIEQLQRERAAADREVERLRHALAYANLSACFYLCEIGRRCGDEATEEVIGAWGNEWARQRGLGPGAEEQQDG